MKLSRFTQLKNVYLVVDTGNDCQACEEVDTYENIMDNFCRADFGMFCYFHIFLSFKYFGDNLAKQSKEDRSTFFCVTRNSKINVEIIQLHAPNCDA